MSNRVGWDERANPGTYRFWSKVDVLEENECWPWKAYLDRGGYGRFGIQGRSQVSAHSVALQFATGELPRDRLALHRCDNRKCCNPRHLYWGTHSDNMFDRERARVARGERHFQERLTESEALEAVLKYRALPRINGKVRRSSLKALADELNISTWNIMKLARGASPRARRVADAIERGEVKLEIPKEEK